MPSEKNLMDRYGISRITVRQALQKLQTESVAYKVQGKGTFVSTPRRSLLRGFQNMERNLSEQGKCVTTVFIGSYDVPTNTLLGTPSDWTHSFVRILKRLKLADGRPFAFEVRIFPMDVIGILSEEDLKSKPIFDLLDANRETEVVRVAYSITAGTATEEEATHFRVPLGTPTLSRSGIYYDKNQKPVMVGKVIFLADRAELQFECHKEDDNWGIVKAL
jgi:GntR family transcriptional regulator